jgi:hypothetical protein
MFWNRVEEIKQKPEWIGRIEWCVSLSLREKE